jgi:hypothetical protein
LRQHHHGVNNQLFLTASLLAGMCLLQELDYVREGRNATRFAEQMAVDLPQVSSRAGTCYR